MTHHTKKSPLKCLLPIQGAIAVKNSIPPYSPLRAALSSWLLGLALVPGTLFAVQQNGKTDVANIPLGTVQTVPVKPNVMFVLDDSGSMERDYMPDDALSFAGRYGHSSPQCNGLAYNPAIKYEPPKNADGSSFGNSSFTEAHDDGYNSSSPKSNLTGSTYYKYTGKQTDKNYADTSSTFYKECKSAIGSDPGKSVFEKVTVPATDQVNYANWFTFYRTRMLMAKTAAGRAFATISDNYRVGFMTIHTTAGDTADYVGIGDFNSTKKNAWFSKFYSQVPGSATPLRDALSLAGSMYAGTKLDDPVQYSCQQNFTILSTDGYWNGGDGYKPDGTNVGDQDHSDARPYFDGGKYKVKKSVTTTTVTVTQERNKKSDTESCGNNGKYSNKTVTTTSTVETIIDNGVEGPPSAPVVSTSPPSWSKKCKDLSNLLPASGPTSTVGAPVLTAIDGSEIADTLADVAEYYYKTDLRDEDKLSAASCSKGALRVDGTHADVCKDNVPSTGKDAANWQHMTTFTIGFGVNGQLKYAENYEADGSADYNAIVQGTKDWPIPKADDRTAVDDLWHAAVNGRGKYFSAQNPDAVVKGIATALAGVSARLGAGAAAATSNLEPVAGDNYAFVANYRTVSWDGDLQARTVDLLSGQITDGTAPIWSAQKVLDKRVYENGTARTIYTFDGSASNKLKEFTTANFSAAEKNDWFNPNRLKRYLSFTNDQQTAATPDSIIEFLRGKPDFEDQVGNANRLYRDREHVLGDIINGRPAFSSNIRPYKYLDAGYAGFKSSMANRKKAVYLSANDGMLHAFDAQNGNELWAYIPSAVLPNLINLANTVYDHQFYVDGSPIVADVYDSSDGWRTILVGGLNAGGKSYYALDVTDPASPKALWEFTHPQLGLTFGNPLIGKLINGKWIVAVSSGYNNTDGVGRLFILDASTGALIGSPISTGVGSATNPSGLGKMAAWVNDALVDNTIQRIYGGDLLGNLWRFDVNDIIAPAGQEAALLAQFTVSGKPQPITTRPEVGLYGSNQIVYVGTGQLLGTSDLTTNDQQSLYAIKDTLTATGWGDIRAASCLVQQQIVRNTAGVLSTTVNPMSWASKCGWYVDFNPGGKNARERVNVDMVLQLGVLTVASNSPDTDECVMGGHGVKYKLDYATGTYVSTSLNQAAGDEIGNALIVGVNVYMLPSGKVVSTVTTSDDKHLTSDNPSNPNAGGGGGGKRKGWRQLINK
jgi:type IV pilus assembly protein PilY1